MNVRDLKPESQIRTLRHICNRIQALENDWLEQTAEELLCAMVAVLDDQECDDVWGTEGWKHFFDVEQ